MLTKKRFLIGTITSYIIISLFQVNTASADSSISDDYNFLLITVLVGSVLVGLLVAGLLGYFIYKYREGTSTPRNPIKNEFKYEAAWITLAVVLAGILMVISTPVILDIQNPAGAEDAELIHIEAHSWFWVQLKYFDNGTLQEEKVINLDNPLELETGKLYKINITSVDVIHSFFAYDLSFKIDAVPGQFNTFFLQINTDGDYIFTCAEFCGNAHYDMKGKIRATSS